MLARPTIFLALLLALAGCGMSQKDAYRGDFSRVAKQFKVSLERAASRIPSGASLSQRAPAIGAARVTVDKLARDLAGLHPPASLERTNSDAVQELHTLSSDLGDYGAAARAGDAKRAQGAVPKVQADQTLLQKTLDALDRGAAR